MNLKPPLAGDNSTRDCPHFTAKKITKSFITSLLLHTKEARLRFVIKRFTAVGRLTDTISKVRHYLKSLLQAYALISLFDIIALKLPLCKISGKVSGFSEKKLFYRL